MQKVKLGDWLVNSEIWNLYPFNSCTKNVQNLKFLQIWFTQGHSEKKLITYTNNDTPLYQKAKDTWFQISNRNKIVPKQAQKPLKQNLKFQSDFCGYFFVLKAKTPEGSS